MMEWYPQPFGPFQSFHDNILANAKPVTWSNGWEVALHLLPLLLQAFLLQYEGTRLYRLAISIPASALMCRLATTYRFDDPQYTAYNYVFGIGWMHLIITSIRFGLIKEPVIDPYAAGRSRLFSASDLIGNIRWIGLRPIDFPTPSTSSATASKRNAAQQNRQAFQNGDAKTKSLPPPPLEKQKISSPTRTQAMLYHFWTFLPHYLSITTIIYLLRHFGKGTVDRSYLTSSDVDQFQNQQFFLFPNSPIMTPIPRMINAVVIEVVVGVLIWGSLVAGYNFIALTVIGLGIFEPDAWMPNLFEGNPWSEESLLGFWKSWHQIFRQDFIHLSSLILWPFSRILPTSITRPFQILLPFTISGLMHSLGLYLTEPTPRPWPLFVFFFQHGVGCIAEILFHRMTGRKVRGFIGLLWKLAFIGITGYKPMRAMMEGGFGGCALILDVGVGKVIGDFIIRYILGTALAWGSHIASASISESVLSRAST